MKPVYDIEADVGWPEAIEDADWRDLPDLDDDDLENDEDEPASEHVIDLLGFDPDEEEWD